MVSGPIHPAPTPKPHYLHCTVPCSPPPPLPPLLGWWRQAGRKTLLVVPWAQYLESCEKMAHTTATIAEAPLLRPSIEEWADPITYMKRVRPIVEQ